MSPMSRLPQRSSAAKTCLLDKICRAVMRGFRPNGEQLYLNGVREDLLCRMQLGVVCKTQPIVSTDGRYSFGETKMERGAHFSTHDE